MEIGRVELTAELQKAYQVSHSLGEKGPGIGTTKREFISCRKGEHKSARENSTKKMIENLKSALPEKELTAMLGFSIDSIQLKKHCKRNGYVRYLKNIQTKKLLEKFNDYLKRDGITRIHIVGEIRKEQGESYCYQTLKDSLDPNKKTIPPGVFNYVLKKTASVYGENEVKSYCGVKNLENIAESDRIPVDDALVEKLSKNMKELGVGRKKYAKIVGGDSTTLIRILKKRQATASKRMLDLEKISEEKFEKLAREFVSLYPGMKKRTPASCLVYFNRLVRKYAPKHGISEENAKKSIINRLEKEGYISPLSDPSIYDLPLTEEIKKMDDENYLESHLDE